MKSNLKQKSLLASILPEKKRTKLTRVKSHEVIHAPIPNQKKRKRIGRGHATGHGKTSGRGHKGQRARVGYSYRSGFEGGQTPLFRRLPKRGFDNIFKLKYQLVNLDDLAKIKDTKEINPKYLEEHGFISKQTKPVKVLANGEIKEKLHIVADAFSKKAIELIEKAGGKIEIRKEAPKLKSAAKVKKAKEVKIANLPKRKEIRKYNTSRKHKIK